MGAKGCAGLAALGLLAATFSACGIWGHGGSDIAPVEVQSDNSDLPARYGLYVEAKGVLGRLDVEKSVQVQTWDSRSNLHPDVTFIIFDRSLADHSLRLSDAITLRKVAHVRNNIATSGAATPGQKDPWVVADFPEFAVPLDFQPIDGSPEIVRVIPTRPLASGLYSLQIPRRQVNRRRTLRRPMVEGRRGPIRLRQLRRPLCRIATRLQALLRPVIAAAQAAHHSALTATASGPKATQPAR